MMDSRRNFTFIEGHVNTSMKNRLSTMVKAFVAGEDVLFLSQRVLGLPDSNLLGVNNGHNLFQSIASEIFKNLNNDVKEEISEIKYENIENEVSAYAVGKRNNHNHSVVIDYESSLKMSCKVSYVELHQEHMYDLLEPLCGRKRKRVFLDTEIKGKAFIKGLKEFDVKNDITVITNLEFGEQNLQAAASLNNVSSNSHRLFIFKLKDRHNNTNQDISTLTICDLAQCTKAEYNGGLKSSVPVKKDSVDDVSLLALKQCLEIFQKNQSSLRKKRFPVKKSILTRLCATFFEGKGHVMVFYNIEKPLVKDLELDNTFLKTKVKEQDNEMEKYKYALDSKLKTINNYERVISQQVIQVNELKSACKEKTEIIKALLGKREKTESKHERTVALMNAGRDKMMSKIKLANETIMNLNHNLSTVTKQRDDAMNENEKLKKQVSDIQYKNKELEKHERPSKRICIKKSTDNMDIALKSNAMTSQTRFLHTYNILSSFTKKNIEDTLNSLKEDNGTINIIAFQNYKPIERQIPLTDGKVGDYHLYWTFNGKDCFGIGLMSKMAPIKVFYHIDSDDLLKSKALVMVAEYDMFYVIYLNGPIALNDAADERKGFFDSFKDYIKCLNPRKKTVVCGNLNYIEDNIEFMKIRNAFRVLMKAGCALSFQELILKPDSVVYSF